MLSTAVAAAHTPLICPCPSPTAVIAGRAIGDAGSGVGASTRAGVVCLEAHAQFAQIYLRTLALPVLTLFVLLYTASLLAVMHPSCGRLGCAVAVGMGNMFGSGETGRKCMFISPGVATRGLTGVQCVIRNDHNVVCARMRCSVTTIKVGDRFQNIAIISVIPNMVKAGYRG